MSNFERLNRVFETVLADEGAKQFSLEATMDDIEGWNSLNFLEIIMEIESEFGVSIDGLDAAEMTSIQKILEFLEKQS